MLHVTNGDVVAQLLELTGLPGEIVAWDDVLHEGPVPQAPSDERFDRIRAQFIDVCGWAPYEDALERFHRRRERLLAEPAEVVLWFEHDLFDQLQLLQVLEHLSRAAEPPGAVTLVCPGDYLGRFSPGQLAALFPSRERLGDAAFDLASLAWAAFRAPDPSELAGLAGRESPPLEHLAPALRRLLQEFPALDTGLARTERQILELVSSGIVDRHDLFRENASYEEAIYSGDLAFLLHVRRLDRAGALLDRGTVSLTDLGRAVVTGEADLVRDAGITRWVGGVELKGHDVPWRWDETTGGLVDASPMSR